MSTFEKGFEVIPAKPGAERKTYTVGNKKMSFGGSNVFTVKDSAVARDLESLYGGRKNSESDDLRVIPISDMRADPTGIHRYSFALHNMGEWKSRIDWSK